MKIYTNQELGEGKVILKFPSMPSHDDRELLRTIIATAFPSSHSRASGNAIYYYKSETSGDWAASDSEHYAPNLPIQDLDDFINEDEVIQGENYNIY